MQLTKQINHMKKSLFLITAFLFAFQLSNGQTEKGTQNLGANFGFDYGSSNDLLIYPNQTPIVTQTANSKRTNFVIGPNYSYFIADKLDIGINFSYGSSSNTTSTENLATTNDNYPVKQSSYNVGGNIFIRKYFMYENKIGFRTGAYLGYDNGDSKTTYSSVYTTSNYNSLTSDYYGGVKVDLVYYPVRKLGVSATIANLQYSHYKFNNETFGNQSQNNVGFGFINNNLSLSVFYVFSK